MVYLLYKTCIFGYFLIILHLYVKYRGVSATILFPNLFFYKITTISNLLSTTQNKQMGEPIDHGDCWFSLFIFQPQIEISEICELFSPIFHKPHLSFVFIFLYTHTIYLRMTKKLKNEQYTNFKFFLCLDSINLTDFYSSHQTFHVQKISDFCNPQRDFGR